MASASGSFLSRKVIAPQKLSDAAKLKKQKIDARFLHPTKKCCVIMRNALDRLTLTIVIFTMVEENFEIHALTLTDFDESHPHYGRRGK